MDTEDDPLSPGMLWMVLRGGDIWALSQRMRGDHWVAGGGEDPGRRGRWYKGREHNEYLTLKLHGKRAKEDAGRGGAMCLGCICSKWVPKDGVDATELGTAKGQVGKDVVRQAEWAEALPAPNPASTEDQGSSNVL